MISSLHWRGLVAMKGGATRKHELNKELTRMGSYLAALGKLVGLF